jgi:hypothetical protein
MVSISIITPSSRISASPTSVTAITEAIILFDERGLASDLRVAILLAVAALNLAPYILVSIKPE